MIIDDITPDDIITVLEHVHATCAVRSYCDGCRYLMRGDGCALAHIPGRWKLDDIIRNGGDADDQD